MSHPRPGSEGPASAPESVALANPELPELDPGLVAFDPGLVALLDPSPEPVPLDPASARLPTPPDEDPELVPPPPFPLEPPGPALLAPELLTLDPLLAPELLALDPLLAPGRRPERPSGPPASAMSGTSGNPMMLAHAMASRDEGNVSKKRTCRMGWVQLTLPHATVIPGTRRRPRRGSSAMSRTAEGSLAPCAAAWSTTRSFTSAACRAR